MTVTGNDEAKEVRVWSPLHTMEAGLTAATDQVPWVCAVGAEEQAVGANAEERAVDRAKDSNMGLTDFLLLYN
jgi:hypothetical protein